VRYLEEAKSIWAAYVPDRGQADTVQGELLRAVEKLRDEAVRNGNLNWDEGHRTLGEFLGRELTGAGIFGPEAISEIRHNIRLALDAEHPADDALYDQLADRVVEWCQAHAAPVPHAHDPGLLR